MPGIVLDQDAQEPLDAAEHGPVDHHRRMLGAVLADEERAQPLRQVEVELHRAALPFAADGVAQRIFELRPVERALARIDAVRQAGLLQRRLERRLGHVPNLVRADALRRPGRELDQHVVEAEVAVDRRIMLCMFMHSSII